MKKERKLHIGGKVKADGWEIINAVKADYVDHFGDASDLSRFEDNTFSAIYASHVLEHFDYKDNLLKTLKEWWRVLDFGGKLYISVPDMDVLSELFLDKDRLTGQERFQVMRMMFGGHVDEYDYHYVGLNQEFLVGFLKSAGFGKVSRAQKFGIFPDTSGMIFKDKLISLNIVGEKEIPKAKIKPKNDISTLLGKLAIEIFTYHDEFSFSILEVGARPLSINPERFYQLLEIFPDSVISAIEVDEKVCEELNKNTPEGGCNLKNTKPSFSL